MFHALSAAVALLPPPEYAPGRATIAAYFRDQVAQIAAATLPTAPAKAEWETKRPVLRRQFLDMMGLWPMPARTALHPVVAGTEDCGTFVVEKLHFQSRPGLYVTANLWRPKAAGKYPGILYVCGHGTVVENGISYGSKVQYQYHPAWFAAHGYVCLALDTLQLGEIVGHHHGTYSMGMWWWQSRGYTPGGVELWNAIRALDYLETRPEVDAAKLGVTGRSGGGATSWWLAAADDRVKCAAPVAGIADLQAHVVEAPAARLRTGVIAGHCDCMFMVNSHRWDFPLVAALVAPRPLLLGNSDDDDIFPVAGYRRIAAKVRPVYEALGAGEAFQLLETKGPHVDTPELRIGINRWMNRWLKNDMTSVVTDDLPAKLPAAKLRVLSKPPEGAINAAVHESFVPAARHELPTAPAVAAAWWTNRRGELLRDLTATTFAGWPKTPPPLGAKVSADRTHDGVRLRAVDFVSETQVPLRLWVLTAGDAEPTKLILSVLDEPGWVQWCRDLGPAFAAELGTSATLDAAKFAQNKRAMAANRWAFAAVCPRGVGPTKWAADGTADDIHIRRRFALIGQTLDGQRVWDVRRAVAAVKTVTAAPVTLHGEGHAAGVALYAGLYEPAVAGFDLWHLPASHRDGPTLLNVLKVLDVSQAVALAAPRPVTLTVKTAADRAAWDWPLAVQAATGGATLKVTVGE